MPTIQNYFKFILSILVLCLLFVAGRPPSCEAQDAADSTPVVVNVMCDPAIPRTGDTIKLTFELAGGAIRTETDWNINGKQIQVSEHDSQTTSVQLNHPIKQGDAITATITAFDIRNNPGRARVVRMLCKNGPPTVRMVNQTFQDGRYTAKVEAKDPDGDPIKLSLEQGPESLKMDEDGNIEWPLVQDKSGNFPVKVAAEDDQGNKSSVVYEIRLRWTK